MDKFVIACCQCVSYSQMVMLSLPLIVEASSLLQETPEEK